MTKIVSLIFKTANLFFAGIFLLSCLIPFLAAGKFWMIAVLGLVFPLLVVIVFLFMIIWLFVRSKWFLLSFCSLLLGWQQISVMASYHQSRKFEMEKTAETLRIMSWNVSSWGQTNKSQLPQTNYGSLTFDLIKNQHADVLCFQEYFDRDDWYSHSLNIKAFGDLGYKYHYLAKSYLDKEELKIGVIILSKFPITDSAKFAYGQQDKAEHLIYADIAIKDQKIRLFTTHLQSVQFEDNEYSAVEKLKETNKSGLKDSKTIVHKLKYAYQYRKKEADLINEKIKESPYPVIICGDFNDVPNSYTYFTVRGSLQDAFLRTGSGFGRTFQYLSPTLRIDYILADKSFEITQYNRYRVPYSDHYPIIADIQLPANK